MSFPDLPNQLKVFLYEALRELLLNAVKHSGEDMATITLHPPHAEQITITVSDGGLGFDSNELEQQGEGLRGFGLFSIRERLLALGGSLQIDSVPNEGTSFIITVPLTDLPAPRQTAPVLFSPPTPSRRQKKQPIRVLIVDNYRLIREDLTLLLEHEADIEVVGQAGNGLEAIARTTELQPDVVIMDIEMPQLDGIEATRRLKESYPQLVIIALSISDTSAQREKMRQAGAAAYFRKDSDVKLLVKTIRTLG
jgi:CheY-like chemotaxis protein